MKATFFKKYSVEHEIVLNGKKNCDYHEKRISTLVLTYKSIHTGQIETANVSVIKNLVWPGDSRLESFNISEPLSQLVGAFNLTGRGYQKVLVGYIDNVSKYWHEECGYFSGKVEHETESRYEIIWQEIVIQDTKILAIEKTDKPLEFSEKNEAWEICSLMESATFDGSYRELNEYLQKHFTIALSDAEIEELENGNFIQKSGEKNGNRYKNAIIKKY